MKRKKFIQVFPHAGDAPPSVGYINLSIKEFESQALAAGMREEEIPKFVQTGHFDYVQSRKGEIKWCPTCKKIRQTSCGACGCGFCSFCNHRWSCSS